MKKNLKIIVEALLVALVVFGIYNRGKITSDGEETEVLEPKYLKLNSLVDDYSTYVYYVEDNIIYGEIHNSAEEFAQAEALFSYNIKTEEFNKYPLDKERLIKGFYKLDNHFYYVDMIIGEKSTKWELNVASLDFKETKTLIEGNVLSEFNSPIIFRDADNLVYLLALNNAGNNEETTIYKLADEKIESLITFKGNNKTKKGQFLHDMLYVDSYGDNISLGLVEDYKTNSVYRFNLKTKDLQKLASLDLDEGKYNSYFFTKDGCFLNIENSEGQITSKYIDGEGETTDFNYQNLNFGRNLDAENMLFHKDKEWYILNTQTKEINKAEISGDEWDDNYYVVDKNHIITTNKSHYYLVEVA